MRCIGCDPRNNPQAYLLVRKAHNSIYRHARSFGLSKADFAERFGWHHKRMADDLDHARTGICPYCRDRITDLRSLTFDVIDPTKPPTYSSNVRICCLKCNVQKKTMSQEAWAERLDTWEKYREWIEKLKNNPVENLPLFGNM